jgi:hypothetical protein
MANRFVVVRHNWRRSGPGWALAPGTVRLASFADAAEAEADRAAREANVHRRIDPFTCGPLIKLTSLPAPVWGDLLADLGLEAPETGYEGWWAAVPEASRPAIWRALDRLRFYSVEERPDRPVGYAVLSLNWEYNDEYYYLHDEGGVVQAVYRTRRRAEEEGLSRFGHGGNGARDNYFPVDTDPFDPESVWRGFLDGHRNFEVVEIELEGL